MRITWLGHACFLLEAEGFRLVIDPYEGVEGYPPLRVEANAVFCSHAHHDHNAVGCVTLHPAGETPFSVREVPTFHDAAQGALRGSNTVRIFSAGGVTAAHLGDLGHLPTPQQAAEIGAVDALLVPVGGTYTIDANEAAAVCRLLRPRCVVPMHYRHAPYGLPEVAGVEPFLAHWPEAEVHRLNRADFLLDGTCSGVVVPKFQSRT